MHKKFFSLFLSGLLLFSTAACGPGTQLERVTISAEDIVVAPSEEQTSVPEDSSAPPETAASDDMALCFSFESLKPFTFVFSSGAGAWSTTLTIQEDGSFSGQYSDSDAGSYSDAYPNGTQYLCDFTGSFSQPVIVNENTFSVKVEEMKFANQPGTEEIMNDVRVLYSECYGLAEGDELFISVPGTPLEDISEEYRNWLHFYDLSSSEEVTLLPYFALLNETQQTAFSSYDSRDNLKAVLDMAQTRAAELETSLANESLTQLEMNETAKELYQTWDDALNATWGVLKQTLSAEAMRSLTAEQKIWISEKEQAAADTGASYAGSSMQDLVVWQKKAELTKERFYELLEYAGLSD